MRASSFFIGPHKTPKGIKTLLWTISAFSLLSPVLSHFLMHTFQLPGPNFWFALSLWGIKKGWLWQLVSYVLVQTPATGISFSFLLSLFFNMLVFWFTGSEIAYRFGNFRFLLLFLTLSLVPGVLAAFLIFLTKSHALICGVIVPITGLILLWTMLYPELEMHFFLFFRIRAKWLSVLLLSLIFLFTLASGELILFLMEVASALTAFLIGRFGFHLENLYPLQFMASKRRTHKNKILDISAFYEDDDFFMDRMLEKITREGEDALTAKEKARMKKISERKNRL